MGPKLAKQSLAELESAAAEGDNNALQSLAMLHELGLVENASVATAVQCYTKAVKAGDPAAAISLAHLQEQNPNKNPQREKIVEGLYQFAASKGYRRSAERVAETFPKVSKGVILLVDPVDASRAKTKALLEAARYEVRDFFEPYRALRLIENGETIHLVISDLQMKELDGVEFLQLIRQRYQRSDLPLIMLAPSKDLEPLKRAKGFGVQGWILKPYDPLALVQTVHKLFAPLKKAS